MKSDLSLQTITINSVRVPGTDVGKMLNWLDQGETTVDKSKRKHERRRYRTRGAVVYLRQAESIVAFTVPTRNISEEGLAFLHGQMMYVGQPCVVHLATKDGQWLTIDATVVRCRHVKAMIHEIGLKFAKPIDLDGLLHVEAPAATESAVEPQATPSQGES